MNTDEKKCRFCAEVIKRDAKVCRFCGRDLDALTEPTPIVKARSGVMDGVKLGCGMFVILPILLILGVIAFVLGIPMAATMIRNQESKARPPAAKTSTKDAAQKARGISPADFKIVSHRGEWQNDRLRIIGEIRNKGAVSAGVEIEVIARDDKGGVIESKTFWPNSTTNIAPGGTCGIGYTITKDTRAKTIEVKVIDVNVW